jgi:hypothetical protein
LLLCGKQLVATKVPLARATHDESIVIRQLNQLDSGAVPEKGNIDQRKESNEHGGTDNQDYERLSIEQASSGFHRRLYNMSSFILHENSYGPAPLLQLKTRQYRA